MAFSDWYEVKDFQLMFGQPILNIYHVERADPGVSATNILDAFADSILTPLKVVQPIALSHTSFEAVSLDNPLDFATRVPASGAGLRVGDPYSQFTVLTIQFNRLRTDMKNGQKRITGGVELDSAGQSWSAGLLTDGGTLATALMTPWERIAFPGVPVCRYGILKRICVGTPPPDPCQQYRLPKDDLELKFYLPIVAIVRGNKRSQVSRKVL